MPLINHVHIAGAGIAGLVMALCLQQQGIEFTLYEQEPSISYHEVGLGLSSNVFPILDTLGLLSDTRMLGDEILTFRFADKQLEALKEFQLEYPALSINRKLFHQLLYNRVDKSKLRLHTRFQASFSISDNDIVVGADGMHSAVRGWLYNSIPIRNSGQVLWRGVACLPLPDEFKFAYNDIIGGNLRFAVIHNRGNHYFWYAITQGSADKVIIPSAAARQMLMKVFADYHPVVNMIIHATDNIYCNYLQDIRPSDRRVPWYQGNTVLVGDAIHPATPNLANGACLAIEDVYVLSRLMQQHTGGSFESIFAQYQKLREPKVNRIVHQSWYLGKLMHQPNKMMDRVMIMGTRLTPAFLFKKIYAPVLQADYRKIIIPVAT